MKTLEHNAISRALMTMGFRLQEEMYAKRHEHDATKLAEIFQHYQLEVSGVAGAGAVTDFTIHFQEIFYYAPLQRNVKTEDPQFTWGSVLDSGEAKFHAHVKQWLLDDSANYKGAIVRVGVEEVAWSPGSAFVGTIHVTFQGLALPVEDPGHDETPEPGGT